MAVFISTQGLFYVHSHRNIPLAKLRHNCHRCNIHDRLNIKKLSNLIDEQSKILVL